MKKIWIIYNSKYGNCRKLSEELAYKLKKDFDVKISNISDISPESIVNEKPDAILVGARIIIGKPDKKIRKFLFKLADCLDKPIPKAGTFYTHGETWIEDHSTLIPQMMDLNITEDIFLEILEIKLQKIKGPAEPGQEKKINEFIETFSHFVLI